MYMVDSTICNTRGRDNRSDHGIFAYMIMEFLIHFAHDIQEGSSNRIQRHQDIWRHTLLVTDANAMQCSEMTM